MASFEADRGEDRALDWRIPLILFLIAFFVRLPLIGWFTAEYSDAILLITIFHSDLAYHPPLYGTLLSLLYNFFEFIPTYETAGRFISLLADSLCVIPIYLTGRYIFNRKTAVYAVLLFIFSAMALRWSVRTMTESLFTLLFTAGIYCFIRFYYEPQRKWLGLGFFIAGLALLTRNQGMALGLIVGALFLREVKLKRFSNVIFSLWGIIPWLVFLWWVFVYRGFAHTGSFAGEVTGFTEYLRMLTGYLLVIPYSLTYPVFLLSCYGAFKAWKVERGRAFLLLFAAILVVWLFSHTIVMALVARYFLPLFPFFMIFAAYGITRLKWDRAVLAAALVVTVAFSVAVFHFQRDSFGDLKRAAEWVRLNVAPGEMVYATDIRTFKTKFWTRRNVEELKPGAILHSGDYLILHSFYVSIPDKLEEIGESFYIERLYETRSSIVPILPDLTQPSKYTNHLGWNKVKFKRNNFRSVVLRLGERK